MTTTADSAQHLAELGPNAGLVDEMYRLYRENPNAVSPGWREFFADYQPPRRRRCSPRPRRPAPAAAPPGPPPAPTARRAPVDARRRVTAEPLRGASARVVENMEASLGVPTATSVRAVPAKLLEINRQILNNQLARDRGGKVSFTHLIGFAVVAARSRRCRA